MHKRLPTLTFFFALTAYLLPCNAQTLKGYSVDVGDFKELVVNNSVPVDFMACKDSAGIVTFTAEEIVSQAIMFENKKGKLIISLEPRTFNRQHCIPKVTVRSNLIKSVTNYGDSTVRVLKNPYLEKFKAQISGNGSLSLRDITAYEVKASLKLGGGQIYITGDCQKAILDNTGTGMLQAGGLQAKSSVCYIMGTGNIDCNASNELSIKGIGSGSIIYGGNPSEIRNRGVGLKVTPLRTTEK